MQGIGLEWFRSFLRNLTQRCLVNGSLSRVCWHKCGVPWGKILGPLLFLIYINDLPNCLASCQPGMYADNTHLTYADVDVNSIQLNLNHDLGYQNKWLISTNLIWTLLKLNLCQLNQDKNWVLCRANPSSRLIMLRWKKLPL